MGDVGSSPQRKVALAAKNIEASSRTKNHVVPADLWD